MPNKKVLAYARTEIKQREGINRRLFEELAPLDDDVAKLKLRLEKATEKRDAKLDEIRAQETAVREMQDASETLKTSQMYRDSGQSDLGEEAEAGAREIISRYTGINSVLSMSRSPLRYGY